MFGFNNNKNDDPFGLFPQNNNGFNMNLDDETKDKLQQGLDNSSNSGSSSSGSSSSGSSSSGSSSSSSSSSSGSSSSNSSGSSSSSSNSSSSGSSGNVNLGGWDGSGTNPDGTHVGPSVTPNTESKPSSGGGVFDILNGTKEPPKKEEKPYKPMEKTEVEKAKERLEAAKKAEEAAKTKKDTAFAEVELTKKDADKAWDEYFALAEKAKGTGSEADKKAADEARQKAVDAEAEHQKLSDAYFARDENDAPTGVKGEYDNAWSELQSAQSAYDKLMKDKASAGYESKTDEEKESLRDKIKDLNNQKVEKNPIFGLGHGKDIEGPFISDDTSKKPEPKPEPSKPSTPQTNSEGQELSQEDKDRLEAEALAKKPYEAMENIKNAYKKSFKGWEFDDNGYKPIYEDNFDGVQKENGPMQQQTKVEQNIQSNQESVKGGEGLEINKIGKDPADKISQPGVANSVVGTSVGRTAVGEAGPNPVNFDASRSYSDRFTDGGFANRNEKLGLAPDSTTNFTEDPWNQGLQQQSNTAVSDKEMKVFIKHCSGDPVMKRIATLIKERI